MKIRNPILAADSYKISHFAQYPKGAQYVVSYIEARGSKIPGCDDIVVFGLKAFIDDFLVNSRVTVAHVEQAKAYFEKEGTPFNYEGWMHIAKNHSGRLPVEIDALPEGTVVKPGTPMVIIRNTDETVPWVTSFCETLMLSYIWYGSTVATLSRHIKGIIYKYLEKTSDNPDDEIEWKLHDFGMRGATPGSADIGGAAHLINFRGSDTMPASEFIADHYDVDMFGWSIPASEHSTITSWGREGEFDAYVNLIVTYAHPGKTFACVMDSYNIWSALYWLCHEKIDQFGGLTPMEYVRKQGATMVVRPDSGHPVNTPVEVVDILIAYLTEEGVYSNSKGYTVLPDYVRVIQGDGIGPDEVEGILKALELLNISASNITFGMGGGLLQKVNRDTLKFAMKACEIHLDDGTSRDVYKDPITDQGKASKRGEPLVYYNEEGKLAVTRLRDVTADQIAEMATDMMYFSDRETSILNRNMNNWGAIRARAKLA